MIDTSIAHRSTTVRDGGGKAGAAAPSISQRVSVPMMGRRDVRADLLDSRALTQPASANIDGREQTNVAPLVACGDEQMSGLLRSVPKGVEMIAARVQAPFRMSGHSTVGAEEGANLPQRATSDRPNYTLPFRIAARDRRVQAQIEAHPTFYQAQHARALGLTGQQVSIAAKRLGLTFARRQTADNESANRAMSLDESTTTDAARLPRATGAVRAQLLAAHAEHPSWIASEHAEALGVSRERIRQLASALRLTLPRGRRGGPRVRPPSADVARRLAAADEALCREPTIPTLTALAVKIGVTRHLLVHNLKRYNPDVIARFAAIDRPLTKMARIRDAVKADSITSLTRLAQSMQIDRVVFAATVSHLERVDECSYRMGREDGRRRAPEAGHEPVARRLKLAVLLRHLDDAEGALHDDATIQTVPDLAAKIGVSERVLQRTMRMHRPRMLVHFTSAAGAETQRDRIRAAVISDATTALSSLADAMQINRRVFATTVCDLQRADGRSYGIGRERRSGAKGATTKTARVRAAVISDTTTPLAYLADAIGIDRAVFAATVWRLERIDGRNYRNGRERRRRCPRERHRAEPR